MKELSTRWNQIIKLKDDGTLYGVEKDTGKLYLLLAIKTEYKNLEVIEVKTFIEE